MSNFFRSFTFYNDRGNNFRHKLEKSQTDKKIFRTLGYFDEFKTEKIVFKHPDGDMDFLWEQINLMNEKIIDTNDNKIVDTSFQNIFGFPCNYKLDNNHEVNDEFFWNSDEYAFTFIILVQFFSKDENDILLEQKIKSYKMKFCENINENLLQYRKKFFWDESIEYPVADILKGDELETEYIFTDYLTFDRYDYILAAKTKCYLPFVLAMQQLYSLYSYDKKIPIALNSFTVTAIGNKNNLINELVPSICIKFNYDENNIFLYNLKNNNYDSRFSVYEYLKFFNERKLHTALFPELIRDKDKHRLYYISGEDDIRIIAREVEMRNLFKLFEENSVLETNYLYGFSTVINVLYDYDVENAFCDDFTNNNIERDLKNCKELILNLGEIYPNELIKTLIQINSGLFAIRPLNANYRGYGFYSLFVEFKNFVQLLAEIKEPLKTSLISKAFLVTHSFGSALLTTVRSDFREFQIPTFNANLYYAPTKMLVFYRAFLSKLIQFYSVFNNGSAEHFIINTGNEITTRVNEVLSINHTNGSYEKFFVCNMSERNIYMIKNSMIQLNHEVAHFGLRKIRNRNNRVNYIADSYLRAYMSIFKIFLTNRISLERELGNNKIRKLLNYINEEKFTFLFLKKLRYFYLKSFCFESGNHYYMNETISIIKDKILNIEQEFAELISNNLLDFFCNSMNDSISTVFMQYNLFKKIIEQTFSLTKQALLLEPFNYNKGNFDYFIDYHFKECYADVMAILTLKLHPKDYLEALLRGYNSTNKNNKNIVTQFRYFIVLKAFDCAIKEHIAVNNTKNSFIMDWDIDSFDKKNVENGIVVEISNNLSNYINKLQVDLTTSWYDAKTVGFLETIMEEYHSSSYEPSAKFFSLFFYEKNIFTNIVDYLVECIELYFQNIETEDNLLSFLPSDIYRIISSEKNSIDQKIVYIDSLLSSFEKDCSERLTSQNSHKG